MRNRLIYLFSALLLLTAGALSAQDDYFSERNAAEGYDTVNIENRGVQRYLADFSYDKASLTSNYGYSVIGKYSPGASSRPVGVQLRWDSVVPMADIERVVVYLVESEYERDESVLEENLDDPEVRRYYPEAGKREYYLCNMCPDRYCYYIIEEQLRDGQCLIVGRGRFYTTGRVRMLRVGGMANMRDMGGWPTSFDQPVAYGRLFRGNRPNGITETGRNDFVRDEHITADLDLRGSDLGRSPFGPPELVEYYCTNNARYKWALVSGTKALARDLNILADVLGRGGSLFLHCEHGCNRAGTLAFLIEGLLGMNEADLSREYELSGFAYGSVLRNQTYGDMLPLIRSYGSAGDDLAQCFYNFACSIGVSEEALNTIRCEMLCLDRNDPRILSAHRNLQSSVNP